MNSTSTAASSGSVFTPTAARTCLPASPKISSSSSLAPLATSGCCVNVESLLTKTPDADHTGECVDGAFDGLNCPQRVDHALPCRRLGGIRTRAAWHLPDGQQFAILHRQLPGYVQQIARALHRHIRAEWTRHRGQFDRKFLEAIGDFYHENGEFGR